MAEKIEEGGCAFPSEYGVTNGNDGMMLRDFFAAQCLSGLCSLGKNLEDGSAPDEWTQADVVASTAYHIADAMLRARYRCDT